MSSKETNLDFFACGDFIPLERFKSATDNPTSFESKKFLWNDCLFRVFPVGIDKIHCECVLEYRSVINQLKLFKGIWRKKKYRGTGEEMLYLIVRNSSDNPLFYFTIRQNCRKNLSTGVTRFEQILHVQFNPAHWMYLTGEPRAEKHKNYVPANSQGVKFALEDLDRLFATNEFQYLKSSQREPLHTSQFDLNRLDGARDTDAQPCLAPSEDGVMLGTEWLWEEEFSTQADWEESRCQQVLSRFLNCSLAYVCPLDPLKTSHRHTAQTYIKAFKKKKRKTAFDKEVLEEYQRMTVKGENPMGDSYDYVRRGVRARQDVFYIKKRFDPNESSKDRLIAAPLRFEVRMLKRDEIRNSLGISSLAELPALLREVEDWHATGREGAVPRLEHALNARLQKWNEPSSEAIRLLGCEKSKATKNFIDLLMALETASYKTCCRLLEQSNLREHRQSLARIKKYLTKGQALDFTAKEHVLFLLNTAVAGLGPNTVNLTAARVAGYLDSQDRPSGGDSARRAYKRLMGRVEFFCEFYGGDFEDSNFHKRQRAIELLTMLPCHETTSFPALESDFADVWVNTIATNGNHVYAPVHF